MMFAYHLLDALLTQHMTMSGDDYDNNADIMIIMAMIMIIMLITTMSGDWLIVIRHDNNIHTNNCNNYNNYEW